MFRTRSHKLLSGVSTLAVLATFGAVDPVLAAGTTVTGPGFFVNIDTTVTNPPGTTAGNNDFIVVESDAIITTSGGRSFFNASTVNVGVAAATAVLIDDSVLQGTFVNAGTITGTTNGVFSTLARLEDAFSNTGTITGTAGAGLFIDDSDWLGGIANTGGTIAGATAGIFVDNGSFVSGGINNTGSITATAGNGITIDASNVTGGITNSGLVSGTGGNGIMVQGAGAINGGVTNTGTIVGTVTAGVQVTGGSVLNGGIINNSGLITGVTGVTVNGSSALNGGLTNAGTIEGTGGPGIIVTGGSTWNGAISNTGSVVGTSTAILIDTGTNFAGGVSNGGLISGNLIVQTGGLFTGGITNDGTISAGTSVIQIATNLFTGGITNTGLVDATAAGPAVVITAPTFQGGINNDGGTILAEVGTNILVDAANIVFEGGIQNSGLIAGGNTVTGDTGIMINLTGGTFLGGIDNTGGTILAEASTAIFVGNTVLFSGGITNGSLIQSTGAFAINIDAAVPLFEGGITNNAGTIAGGNTAIAINNPVFLGGITNAGSITGVTAGINIAATNQLFDGGITSSAGSLIAAEAGNAIIFSGTVFNGGITNGGLIQTTSGNVIEIVGANFNGGITNTGTVAVTSTGSGVAVNTLTTGIFTGGINNSGLIRGGLNTTAITIADTVAFSGGITNSGTIASGVSGGLGIDITTPLFTGGIANTGRILSFDTAINVASVNFQGGITNSGTIATSGGEGDIAINVVNTTFSGGINNQAGGLIRGTTAINITNTTFTGGISNAGVINGLTGSGIVISNTTFAGGINNSGTIAVATGPTPGAFGVQIDTTDFAGGFTNSGLIQGGSSNAVDISATNFSGGFDNSGTIRSFGGTGVIVQTPTTWTGDFVNSGLISGATDNLSYGTGVFFNATTFSGNFVNSGTINGGQFSGSGVFLLGTTMAGSVTNSGLITALGPNGGLWDGLTLEYTLLGGDVLNSGTILALDTGINVQDGTVIAGSLTNSGLIDPLVGINIQGSILGGVFNSGTIIATSTAINAAGADSAHTITQTGGLIRGNTLADGTGTIATALNLDNGFDDTFIGAGGILDGNVIGGGGEGGSGDDFFVTAPFTYLRGKATGIDQLVFTGGIGAFGVRDTDGNGMDDFDPFGPTGGASANGGVVDFNANDMQVGDAGFALIGDRTTVNLTNDLNVIGDGTVGFLLTTDNLVHGLIDAGGDVNFCADPSPLQPGTFVCTPPATPGGHIVAVVDGVSFGAAGGLGVSDTVNYEDVILAAGTITNTPIDIVPATPGVIDIATNSLFFQAHLESDGALDPDLLEGDIDIVINRLEFGDARLLFPFTQNQQSVGNALEGIWDNGGPFSQQFQDFFALLFSTTSQDDILFWYDELAGAEHAQLLGTSVNLAGILNTFMRERLDGTLLTTGGTHFVNLEAAERRYAQALSLIGSDATGGPVYYGGSHGLVTGGPNSVWLRGFGQWANVDADPEAPGFDQDSDGLAGGYDYALGPNSTIGGALSYASTDVDFDVPGSNADVDTWQLGVYGNYGFGNFYADGMLSYAWHDIATNRVLEIPIPGGPFTAIADYDADTWSIAGELGGIWPVGRVMMQPSIGLNYTDASTDGFSETGAGAFNLTVTDSDADAFTSTLALRAFGRWTMGNTPVLPDLKLGWVHNFNADRHSFTAFMFEDPTVLFPIVSSSINEDAFLVSGGVTAGVSSNVEVFADVNGLYGSDSSTTNASLGLRFVWGDTAAPPPPPPPPAPPAPTVQQWVVYFGSNKCNITAEGETVLAQAADVAKSSGGRVSVVGHADTSASSSESQQISECRANAVKSALAAKGVSDSNINASGKGETDLAVETADGVKEPQNNRVTIDVR
jgi:uncharacterized protein with beta-barrel porin domain